MILSRAGRGYTKPPPGAQINWGHPLARGLSNGLLLNEGGSVPRWLVPKGVQTTEGNPVSSVSVNGLGEKFDGVDDLLWWDFADFTSTALISSTTVIGAVYAGTGVGKTVWAQGSSAADNADRMRIFFGNNDNGDIFVTYGTVNDAESLLGTAELAFNDGKFHVIGSTVNRTPATLTIHVDGVQKNSASLVGFGGHVMDRTAIGGSRRLTSSNFSSAHVIFVYQWLRALSNDEHARLAAEPYAMLLAQSPSVKYFLPAASGVIYPQLERGVRGLNRGVYEGAYR